MVEPTQDDDETKRDDDKEGEGRSGRGKGGSGGGGSGGIRLPPNKLKEIMANWEQLDLAKVVARVAEFFSELPARASANAVVNWGAAAGRQGFAVVNHFISSGTEIAQFMRERTAGHVKRLRTKYGVKVTAAASRGVSQQPNITPTVR